MTQKSLTAILLLLLVHTLAAQPTYPYNGILPKSVTTLALIHGTIVLDDQTSIQDGMMIIQDGRIVSVGAQLSIPSNAVIIDLGGKYVYPSFIDLYSDYGISNSTGQTEKRGNHEVPAALPASDKGAFGWNPAIKSETNASTLFVPKDESAKELRNIGFGAVLSHRMDGIARGTGALVCLADNPNISVIRPIAAACYSFNKGTSNQSYPSSLMGSIALLRQTYYDADWYSKGGSKEERNLSLEALNLSKKLPSIFDAGDKWNVLRADKIGDEFGIQYTMKTSGNEYQRLAEIKQTGASLIVPINFPDAYDVSDPFVTRLVSLEEMKHWELAPANCSMLAKEKINFAITSHGLQDKNLFLKNLRKAVKQGLSEQDALRALTTTPAQILQAEKEIGKLQPGYWANFIITSKNIFADDAVIYENWIQGKQFIIESSKKKNVTGKFQLTISNTNYDLTVNDDGGKNKASIQVIQPSKDKDGKEIQDTLTYPVTLTLMNEQLSISFEAKDNQNKGVIRLAGDISDDEKTWSGKGQLSDGKWIDWKSSKTAEAEVKKNEIKPDNAPIERGDIIYPFVAYGSKSAPTQETILIINATIWTSDAAGKIENGQILISGGKIVAVGQTIDAGKSNGAKVIDAKGKHVTPGIIDEHSHIALESVNEGSQASSAEVEESRVIDPEDINIYRQLSGGVTCSQLLHGSANPIGGQSAIIKLRWGKNAEEMLFKGAPGFIKFALGENVTQSNWWNDGTRFPQSRMGVEQIYYDHFIRAREYGQKKEAYLSSSVKKNTTPLKPFRTDIEMDALYEILQKKRFVTCHSYVQSEINMLMHVADSMQFTLNTFTHILEGYKVADKMKSHGSGASSFSDWWAYKYEVKDAIPYNGALLWEQGITVAFNSDDAEMARRLNQEAAKAVKYGGVPEEEALKFVTINPAKLLHIDKQTGSLAVGKDADLVIWSDHPLSIYARAEKTFVDGVCYYDESRDREMRAVMEKERARLIQKMMASKQNGDPTQMPTFKDKKHFHCDTLDQTSLGISFK
ncbi:MAG: amidohydrolase family protein [Flavobacteriales bacterium]|nr:amidohydrolase family protein [Flavobacteriales bacterium]